MKVLLRNTLTNEFYQGPDRWTPDEQQALDVKQTSRAVELVFDAGLEHVEVLLCYEDPRYNIVLPVSR
ncbi:MAG TPA: hypothetical protein VMU04_25060 [Candidatus Acidoferrum sp.]|nr:hypothetical protein [Candidatus Acidoferrum sp.]